MGVFYFVFFSFLSICGFLGAQSYASPTYTLTSPDDLYDFSSLPPKNNLKVLDSPINSLDGMTLLVTVSETSSGLKDFLYMTTRFEFKQGGTTQIDAVAGPAGTKLDSRIGKATLVYRGKNSLVFLHQDQDYKNSFTNVLYFLSDSTGILISTHDDQWLKGYVQIEKKGSTGKQVSSDASFFQWP